MRQLALTPFRFGKYFRIKPSSNVIIDFRATSHNRCDFFPLHRNDLHLNGYHSRR